MSCINFWTRGTSAVGNWAAAGGGGLVDQNLLDQLSTVPIYSQELQNYFRLHPIYEMSEFFLLAKLIREEEKETKIKKGGYEVSLGANQVAELRQIPDNVDESVGAMTSWFWILKMWPR